MTRVRLALEFNFEMDDTLEQPGASPDPIVWMRRTLPVTKMVDCWVYSISQMCLNLTAIVQRFLDVLRSFSAACYYGRSGHEQNKNLVGVFNFVEASRKNHCMTES